MFDHTIERKCGWLPDKPDSRDFKFSEKTVAKRDFVPKFVDMSNLFSPVEDQLTLGSCTGNSLVSALEFLLIKNNLPFIDLSRLFVYFNERVRENTIYLDRGAQLRTGIQTLAEDGVCSENMWQYDISRFTEKPTDDCYVDAKKRVITSYARLECLEDMKQCLANGYPFVFGFMMYEGFRSQEVARTGIVRMSMRNEPCVGGHAVVAVGYDDDSQTLIVRNSWSAYWGMRGYFRLPYGYVTNHLSADFWTIRAGTSL
jgi:C1A family cysteine protease